MTDKRRARRAKQARRDARRARRAQKRPAEPTPTDILRSALEKHPVSLLSAAGVVVNVALPDRETDSVDSVLKSLCGARNREFTALLAVVGELLVDHPEAQLRCRHEVAQRGHRLPRWIHTLPQVEVYRAVRRTHVLGDRDEVVLGVRLGGGTEMTVGVLIDHLALSGVASAGAVPHPIDRALARVAESSRDTDVVEMDLADARAWIEQALARPMLVPKTETWSLYLPLVRWLVSRLPEDGMGRQPAMSWAAADELCTEFFASSSAGPFTTSEHRDVLLELFETGSGDPLRWSAARVDQALAGSYDCVPLEIALDVPDLLRAFIPYVHARSGVRDELTSRAIAVIDELRRDHRREVLRRAEDWEFGDAV